MLDEWQELVLQAAMGERRDATWAAKRVGLSVPRQNGKSQLLVARVLAGALLFGERKIVVSAHQQDTSRESFTKLLEIIEADGNDALRARVKPGGIMQALNREAVKFTNGAVVQFKARSGPGGRGFSSDCLMLDEAQILSQRAWVSINSTMSAMPNPQVWLMGTPPTPEDDGEVFGNVRKSAMSGKSTSVAWLEWAADPKDDPSLELTRWSANPGWNIRINHEVVDGEFDTYPPERFSLDRLGIWSDPDAASDPFGHGNWLACKVEAPAPGDVTVAGLAVAASYDLSHASIGAAATLDGVTHGRPVMHGPGTHWVPEAAKDLQEKYGIDVVIDPRGPAADLIPVLLEAKVKLRQVSTGDVLDSCSVLFKKVQDRSFGHAGYPELDEAASVAVQRPAGDRWAWGRKKSAADISPLEAVTLAVWQATQTKRRTSIYEERGLETVG